MDKPKILDLTEINESIERNQQLKTAKLSRTDDKVKEGLTRKKQLRDDAKLEEEKSSTFITLFLSAQAKLDQKLVECDGSKLSRTELIAKFDDVMVDCQMLAKFVSDSRTFLPTATFEKYLTLARNLNEKVQEQRGEKVPQKRFAFKSKEKKVASEKSVAKVQLEEVVSTPNVAEIALNITGDDSGQMYIIRDMTDREVRLERAEVEGKIVRLQSLSGCKVLIRGTCLTLKMNELVDCQVCCGPVSSSVYVDDCQRCVFQVAGQQFRMHTSHDCTVHLQVTSGAMVEQCGEIRLAPYSWSYGDITLDWQVSGLDQNLNKYKDINDFDWLVKDVPSPNITFL